MEKFVKRLMLWAILAVLFVGCSKEKPLPFYQDGKAPVLSSSVTTIAPDPSDSLSPVVIFSWTDPGYATDTNTVKYVIQIDSAGGDFSNAPSFAVVGVKSDTLIAKTLNEILVGWGYAFGKPYDINVRLLSSYGNNNEQYVSNTIALKVTPYLIPPKVEVPPSGELFLVGNATDGDWSNPVPLPTQQFAKIDSVTYAGVFHLNAGGEYLILPVNGSWDQKYAVADKSVEGLSEGGDFGYGFADNIPGPDSTGMYKIVLDFQHGKFTVTPFSMELPDKLFMVGDATPGGWNNPVPVPSQEFTRLNSCEFSLSINLSGGKQYLMLPVNNGNWDHKFSVEDNTVDGLAQGGAFGYDLPANFPGPAEDGTYDILVNFANYTFKVTKQ